MTPPLHAIRFAGFALLLAFASAGFAQEGGAYVQTATFDEDMKLVLPTTDRMPYSYEVDVSGLDFASRDAANRYFMSICDNLVRYELDESGTTVTVRLQYANLLPREWDHTQWDDYLTRVSERYMDYYRRMTE